MDRRTATGSRGFALNRTPLSYRALGSAALLLLAPTTCFLLCLAFWSLGPFLVLLIALGSWLAGYSGTLTGRWTVPVVGWFAAVLTALLLPYWIGAFGPAGETDRGTLLWAAILGATMLTVARLPDRAAIWVGAIGGTVACWLGLTLVVWQHNATGWGDALYPPYFLDTARAALWYPASVFWPINFDLGPPEASWLLTDYIEGYPGALTLTTAFSVPYVVGATWTRYEPGPSPRGSDAARSTPAAQV
jgi:hypothetical protein